MKRYRKLFSVATSAFILASLLLLTGGISPLLAQEGVVVSSADPNSVPQGTVNLDVIITGKHFERGAVAKWFVTGTTNPGGVTVNSTAFVNATQLVANVNVSATASVTKFDVVVALSGGRTGKGIELFAVTKKGAKSSCTLAPLPSAFTLVGTLNSASNNGEPLYRGFFGEAVRARKATLGSADVYVVAVGSNSSGKLEVFFLDPLTGAIRDGQVIGSPTGQIQPHLTLPIPPIDSQTNFHAERIAMGDVNADGAPDIAIADWLSGKAYVYVGAVQHGILAYSSAIPLVPPEKWNSFGYSLAMADLDGSLPLGDEVAVGAPGGGTGKAVQNGKVYIFRLNGTPGDPSFVWMRTISSPLPNPKDSDLFGRGVAIGDVAEGAAPDLVVGAPNSDVSQPDGFGRVFVFPGYDLSGALKLSTGKSSNFTDGKVAAADVDGGGYPDVLVTAGTSVLVYSGLVSEGQPPNFTLSSVSGLDMNFGNDMHAGDVNADALADVLVGAPNTSNCPSLGSIGAAYVYLTTPSQPLTTYLLQPPSFDVDYGAYGWSVATLEGSRLFLVSEKGRGVGNVTGAGQVYVYKVN